METPKEYYYTYYSYEEWGRGYFGSRGCKCLPEDDVKYFGSSKDKTFKPTHKIILKDDYATRAEAYADEIILQEHYKVIENPHFANRSYQTSTKFHYKRPPGEPSPMSGKKHSPETKEHLSKVRKGRKHSKDHCKNISKSLFGHQQTDETKQKISKTRKERGCGVGYKHTEETKKKIRLTTKGKHPNTSLWKITFDDGNSLEVMGLRTWAKDNGYDRRCIQRVCNGTSKKYKDIVSVEKRPYSITSSMI